MAIGVWAVVCAVRGELVAGRGVGAGVRQRWGAGGARRIRPSNEMGRAGERADESTEQFYSVALHCIPTVRFIARSKRDR